MPLMLPWWTSWLVNLIVRGVNDWAARSRAEQALRDLGAATQANAARVEAERQETVARRAGEAAFDEPDDPRDLRSDP